MAFGRQVNKPVIPEKRLKQEQFSWKWSIVIQALPFFLTAIGFIIALVQYNLNHNREFRGIIYKEQFEFYKKACTASGAIANIALDSIKSNRYLQAREDFSNLYFGPLNIVQDTSVEKAMIQFYNAMMRFERADPQVRNIHMQYYSFHLAQACRESIQKTYGVQLPELLNLEKNWKN